MKRSLLVLVIALMLPLAHAGGFFQARLSTSTVELFVQQALFDIQAARWSVGLVARYDFGDLIPEAEAYTNLTFYSTDGFSWGLEFETLATENPTVPGQYQLSYELSTLIGVSW